RPADAVGLARPHSARNGAGAILPALQVARPQYLLQIALSRRPGGRHARSRTFPCSLQVLLARALETVRIPPGCSGVDDASARSPAADIAPSPAVPERCRDRGIRRPGPWPCASLPPS